MKQKEIDILIASGITFEVKGDNIVLSNGIVLKRNMFCDGCIENKYLKKYFCKEHNFSYSNWYVSMIKALSD